MSFGEDGVFFTFHGSNYPFVCIFTIINRKQTKNVLYFEILLNLDFDVCNISHFQLVIFLGRMGTEKKDSVTSTPFLKPCLS